MKNALFAFIGVFSLFIALKIFSFSTTVDDTAFKRKFIDKYQIFAITIPKDLDFVGEKVPLEQFDVLERLDRELIVNTYFQSQTLLSHKRASRWFPVIEPILKRYNIPADFKYLALVESGFTNSVSPKNAVGFWQILESTAKEYGLEVNTEVDERYNVEKSTEAACKYLLSAYKEFNNWTLVAASYNMGISGVLKQLNRQKVNSFYDLLLNDETTRYIFRVLAMKEIISKPQSYGYIFREEDLYKPIPTYKVTVDTTISDLVTFAANYEVNYKILKIFNPWLRQTTLANTNGKKYEINFPKYIKSFSKSIENQLIQSNIPEFDFPDTTNTKIFELWHVVKKNEDINFIAKKYNVTVNEIIMWNQLQETYLDEGIELIIYTTPEK